ncbi:MAG: GNAT family N-acetyltransferase [Acidimicrobiales bacterium]
MITVTEEPYDGPVAVELVAALNADINERYAFDMVDMTAEEVAADEAQYRAEVTPALVAAPLGCFVVARLDGTAVGCGAVKPHDSVERIGEVKRMYTAPVARRRGASRAILRYLETAAHDLGYQRLQLETGTAQPEALALYESEGWHRIPPYGHYKDSELSVCYAKALTGPQPFPNSG